MVGNIIRHRASAGLQREHQRFAQAAQVPNVNDFRLKDRKLGFHDGDYAVQERKAAASKPMDAQSIRGRRGGR
jgi:hypothetical protein